MPDLPKRELGRTGISYRGDPLVQALASGTADAGTNEHIRFLREKGWEAFRESRDAIYREGS